MTDLIENLPGEEWKPYRERWAVSSHGRFKRVGGGLIKPDTAGRGRGTSATMRFREDGQRIGVSLYRAMWEAFNGPISAGRKVYCVGSVELKNLVCAPINGVGKTSDLERYYVNLLKPGRKLDSLPIELIGAQPKVTARAICADCKRVDIYDLPKGRFDHDLIRKTFINALNWSIGKKAVCPDCYAARKITFFAKPKEPKPMNKPAFIKPVTTLAAPTPIQPDANGKRNKRLVIVALEDYFDEPARRYRAGHSDETLAKELELSSAFIAAVREEFYGRMAQPIEIENLKLELVALGREHTAVADRMAKAQATIDALCAKHGWV